MSLINASYANATLSTMSARAITSDIKVNGAIVHISDNAVHFYK